MNRRARSNKLRKDDRSGVGVTVYNSAKGPINATVFSNTYSGRMLYVTPLATNHLVNERRTDQF